MVQIGTGGAKQVNRLNDAQKFKLMSHLQHIKDEVLAERPHIAPLARRLSRDLGFRVTENNVVALIEAGIIPKWEPAIRKYRKDAGRSKNYAYTCLSTRVEALEANLKRVCESLGVNYIDPVLPPPPDRKDEAKNQQARREKDTTTFLAEAMEAATRANGESRRPL